MEPNYRKISEALQLFKDIQPTNPDAIVVFAKKFLGIKLHQGQEDWILNSIRVINILKPANQWGKTMIESIIHLYEGMVRPCLYGRVSTPEIWASVRYETLNFGKTYEVARGVLETAEDLAEGNFLLTNGDTNKSLLAGWALRRVIDQANKPPEIIFHTESGRILIRSYDDLGSAFKRKRLAFVSGDECGDVPELNLFTSGTLLPRVSFLRGRIHLVGTSQPQGIEYEELAEKARVAMDIEKEEGTRSEYYFQTGSVFENPHLDPSYLRKIEAVADPELKRQIIYGEYVDYADHYFTMEEVNQMFRDDIDWDESTGLCEPIDRNGKYVMISDFAAGKDETAHTCIRYDIKLVGPDGKLRELPYRIVFHKAFVGETVPLAMQYEMTRYFVRMFREQGLKCDWVYDGQSLGGKNVGEALADLKGRPFPPVGMAASQAKAEALGTSKEVLTRGRRIKFLPGGGKMDIVETWGFLRASSKIKPLRRQFEYYRLDDKKLTQDRLITVAMGLHFIEKRMSHSTHKGAVDFNLSRTIGKYRDRYAIHSR